MNIISTTKVLAIPGLLCFEAYIVDNDGLLGYRQGDITLINH